jgi:hypothetical protein
LSRLITPISGRRVSSKSCSCAMPGTKRAVVVPHPSSLAPRALRRQEPEVGAECPNGARSVLCGGRSVMSGQSTRTCAG